MRQRLILSLFTGRCFEMEYVYNNLTEEEILKLFASLPPAEEGEALLLQKGCADIEEEEIINLLYKGWSVVL